MNALSMAASRVSGVINSSAWWYSETSARIFSGGREPWEGADFICEVEGVGGLDDVHRRRDTERRSVCRRAEVDIL